MEPPGEIDQSGPMLVIQGNPMGGAVFERKALGVAGQEDGVDSRSTRSHADRFGQFGCLSGQVVVRYEPNWVDDQEEDVVAGDSPIRGLTATAAGETAGPEIQDQAQAEALVGLRPPSERIVPSGGS